MNLSLNIFHGWNTNPFLRNAYIVSLLCKGAREEPGDAANASRK